VYLSFRYTPLDRETLKIDGAIAPVLQFDVNMGWRVVVEEHQHPGVIEVLPDGHASKRSAMISLLQ